MLHYSGAEIPTTVSNLNSPEVTTMEKQTRLSIYIQIKNTNLKRFIHLIGQNLNYLLNH